MTFSLKFAKGSFDELDVSADRLLWRPSLDVRHDDSDAAADDVGGERVTLRVTNIVQVVRVAGEPLLSLYCRLTRLTDMNARQNVN